MRISNPTSFAGDQPLATREYVLQNIANNRTDLSGKLDDTKSMLSGNISALKNDVIKWLTGKEASKDNPTGIAKGAGYAYLDDKTGKIDLSLMPPMSITKVLTAAQWEIELAWQNSSFPSDKPIDNVDPDDETIGDYYGPDGKYAAVEAYLNQTTDGTAARHTVICC